MNTKQAREENRIRAALSAFNPLNNEGFCDEIRRSYLIYGDDKLPRKVVNNRMIAGIWREASEDDAFVTRTARKWHRLEPKFNAILAEGWSSLEHDQHPDIPGASCIARDLMVDVLRVEKVRAFGTRPATEAYVARVTERPAFQKAYLDQMAHFASCD